ncbi:MAG: hypothetical protein FIB04_06895 [Gammaproteobacteria bacterium]|nr:hypothetical protein [Gammaproteobacteria bacterium]
MNDRPTVDLHAPGIPGDPRLEVDRVPPEYWRAFTILAFTMNRFIVDHVIRAARQFENDTESLILFGMLSHLNVAHMVLPGSDVRTTLDPRGRLPDPEPRLRPVRIRDLVQITGRPRETIRRKLERMQAAGRVRRVVDGWVLDVSTVDPEMQLLTMDGVRRFLETADNLRSILDDAARALRSDRKSSN